MPPRASPKPVDSKIVLEYRSSSFQRAIGRSWAACTTVVVVVPVVAGFVVVVVVVAVVVVVV